MRWWSLLPLWVGSLSSALARAEPPSEYRPDSPMARPPDTTEATTRVEIASLVGVATSPFFVPEFPEVAGQVFLLETGAARRIFSSVWLGIRVPLAATSIRQPAGSYVDEAAWGNPAIAVEYHDDRPLPSTVGSFGVIRASIGLPLAERGPRASQMANRALALGDALRGLREPSLYAPGMASLSLDYRLDFVRRGWRFGPGISIPLLLRVDGAELPSAETRTIAFRPRADLRASYFFRKGFGLSLDGSLALDLVRAAAPIRRDDTEQRLQPSLRPGVIFDTAFIRVFLSCLAAIGGPVHGSFGCGADGTVRF